MTRKWATLLEASSRRSASAADDGVREGEDAELGGAVEVGLGRAGIGPQPKLALVSLHAPSPILGCWQDGPFYVFDVEAFQVGFLEFVAGERLDEVALDHDAEPVGDHAGAEYVVGGHPDGLALVA